jgi:hypothetical protein
MSFGGIITKEYDSSSIIEKDDTFRCIDIAPLTTPITITVPKSSISTDLKMLSVASNSDLDKMDINDGSLCFNASSGEVFVGRNKKWEPIVETRYGEYKPHGELKPMICTQCGGKIHNRICTSCGTEFYFS